ASTMHTTTSKSGPATLDQGAPPHDASEAITAPVTANGSAKMLWAILMSERARVRHRQSAPAPRTCVLLGLILAPARRIERTLVDPAMIESETGFFFNLCGSDKEIFDVAEFGKG
ncbi:MAG: hypothetical protein J0L61_08170, partial [Planctomycetes bacterium]|nr:hypothetical protein [Planctomycetota bacterium]